MASRLTARLGVLVDDLLASDAGIKWSQQWRLILPVCELAEEVGQKISNCVPSLWKDGLANIEKFLGVPLWHITPHGPLLAVLEQLGHRKFSDIVEVQDGVSPYLTLRSDVAQALGPEMTTKLSDALQEKGIHYVTFPR